MASSVFEQTNRLLAIDTPLGPDTLLLTAFTGEEGISKPFRFDLEMVSEKDDIDASSLIGKNVTLRVKMADGTDRFWNGFISRFSQGAMDDRFTSYNAEFVPWLWFLTLTFDCRIFQAKTIVDIIEIIFADNNFGDYELRLTHSGRYEKRDYCVQYRESDFDFISRLLEEEGIFYFFEHQDGVHKLILADDKGAHKSCPGQEKARYERTSGGRTTDDNVTAWRREDSVRTGKVAMTDYNFETPSTNLYVEAQHEPYSQYELYDYPGEYGVSQEGDTYAKVRLEELTAARSVVSAESRCRGFVSGYKFELTDHYRSDFNSEYVIVSMTHSASQEANIASAGTESDEVEYTNEFECIPAGVQYRPPRVTPRPFVRGVQTAVVVGPPGEEIHTDGHGRVIVQFHWDREGKKNQNSSFWIRVSHPWAGKSWGAVAIPRIGQEVIIDFVEGDPDRPIITGRVYNGEQTVPFGLPGSKVISGMKSNSTLGGGGYNEFIMDDTKGNELIRVHAQFDQDNTVEHDERTLVKNNRTERVGANEKITIGANRTENVGNNETITINSNRTESVGANEVISIGANRTETVGANEIVSIGATRTHNIGVNDMVNVGAAQEINIGAIQSITVGGPVVQTIGGSKTETIAAEQTLSVGKDRASNISKNDSLVIGKGLVIDAGDEVLIKTGAASIHMKKDGTISIKGKDISIDASGKINVKASGNISMKGSKIQQN